MRVIAKENGGMEIRLGESTLLKQHLRCGDWDQVSKKWRAEALTWTVRGPRLHV